MRKRAWGFAAVLLLCVASAGSVRSAGMAGDREALRGLSAGKAVFDVRIADPEKMIFNLGLIKETFEGMQAQGVQPVFVAAFRGSGVKLLTRKGSTEEIRDLLGDLKKMGVRIEVCEVAMRIFKVPPSALLPDAAPVGNVLTSLIGYQNRGYALVPVY